MEYLFESDNLPMLKSLRLVSKRITNVESIEKAKFQLTDLEIYAKELHGSSVRNIIAYGKHLTRLCLNYIEFDHSQLGDLDELKSLKDLWVCSCKSLDAELIGSLHFEQLHWNSDSLRSKNTFIQLISGSPQLKTFVIERGQVYFDLFKLASTQLEELIELHIVTCELLVDSAPVVHFKNLTKLVLFHPELKPSHFKCIGNISTLKFLQCTLPMMTMDDFKNICQ